MKDLCFMLLCVFLMAAAFNWDYDYKKAHLACVNEQLTVVKRPNKLERLGIDKLCESVAQDKAMYFK